MNDALFRKLLIAVTIVGVAVTAGLIAYTAYLYPNASIISFIANGR